MMIWVYPNGWPVPPLVLLGCLVAEILYIRGCMALIKEELMEKAARATPSTARIGVSASLSRWDSWLWRGIYFVIALFLALAGDSAPVDVLSGRLFWVHMIQHLVLMVVIAPLLVAAAPLQPMWLGLPGWVRRLLKACAPLRARQALYQVGHWLRHPAVTCGLLIVGIWVWHWPALYDFALTNDTIHDWGEHLTFFVVSILFWTQVIPSAPLRPRLGYRGQMMCVGFAIIQNVALAVLIGFAPAPLYVPYIRDATAHVTFSALLDQQLGAGIMWTFGDLPFGIALSVLFHRWFATQSGDANVAVQSHRTIGN